MTDFCITCKTLVRPCQEAIQCDGCNKWHNRTCNTGTSHADYTAAVQSDAELQWSCSQCYDAVPLTSTSLEEAASLQISDPSALTIIENETVAPEPLPAVLEEESTVTFATCLLFLFSFVLLQLVINNSVQL